MKTRQLINWFFPRPQPSRRRYTAHQLGIAFARNLDRLEDRVTPVTNTWQGDVNLQWSTPGNWDLDHVPIAGEDVVINNGHTVTHSSGTDTVLSIALSGNSTLLLTGGSITDNGNLSVAAGSEFRLQGGTLANATVPAGSTITGTTSGGSLGGVTIAGTLDLSANSGSVVYVYSGLTLNNGTVNIGSVGASPRYGTLYFYYAGDQTLGGTGTINFGDSASNGIVSNAYYSFDLLTVAPGITIQGANGTISSSTSALEFQGTISSDPTAVGSILANTALTVATSNVGSWQNEGTLRALNGGTLTLGGAWDNTGTITETSSTLNLGGAFTAASVSGLTRTGGTVHLTGVMNNAGNTFTFTATTGSWNLRAGYVQGGTVKAQSGAALVATTFGGSLGGVTLDGTGGNASPLDLSTNSGAVVYINSGLTLNGATINIGSVGVSPRYATLYFYYAGNQTLGGAGTINFGDSVSNSITSNSNYAFDVLTIASGVTVQGAYGAIHGNTTFDLQGTVTSDPTTVASALTNTTINVTSSSPGGWQNEGTLQAENTGILTLTGAWSNTGSITETNGTLNLGGSYSAASVSGLTRTGGTVNVTGTMNNAGNTFTFTAATGSWNLRAGNVLGGTIKAESGAALVATPFAGFLSGVTLDGSGGNVSPLDLSAISGGVTYIFGGLTLNNATINIGSVGASPRYGTLYFYYAGDQTLGGAGTINFGDSVSNSITSNGNYTFDRVTIGPGIAVQGANGAINGNTAFDFLGTITSDPTTVASALTNTQITINPTGVNWQNLGTIQASGTGRIFAQGTNTNFAAGTLTGGTWKVSSNSIMRLLNSGISTIAANIVLDGANSNFYRDGGTTNALTNIAATLSAGSFSILNGRNFTTVGAYSNAGDMTVGAGSTLTLPGVSNYTQTAGITTINGTLTTGGAVDIQGGTLAGGGAVTANVTTTGPVGPGASPGTLTVNGNLTQSATSVLNIELGGTVPGTGYDQIVVSGDATLDGTLNVTRFGGFAPQHGDVYRIVDKTSAGAIAGDLGFAEGATFIADGYSFTISYVGGTGNDITLTAVNIAPTLDPISNPPAILEDAPEQTINLTGITAGGGQTQTLVVTATSDNPGLIPNPTVTYTSPNSTGALHYTPAANQVGSAVITVTVNDGAGGTQTIQRTFTVQVNAVNDAPSFTKGLDQTVLEDAGPQTISSWATSISAGPADESGQTLTFQVSTDNDALFSVLPALSPSGNLTYTPAANMNGSATVTVSLTDNGGTLNGGDNASDPQTFVITLTAVNDAPSFTKGADQFVPEGSGAQNVPGWATNISAGPANESGQSLSFHLTTTNDALFAVLPAIDAGGNLTYTPTANANGDVTVTVHLQDNGGSANGGDDDFTQTFLVTFTPVSDPPALDPLDTRMLPPIPVRGPILSTGSPISDLTKNMTDPDPGPLKGVAITQVDASKGAWQYDLLGAQTGWTDITGVSDDNALLLADDGNTRIRFVPNAGFTGFASLAFRAWDRTNGAAEGTFDDPTDVNDLSYSLLGDRAWIAVGKVASTIDPDGRTVLKPILPVYTATSKIAPLASVLVKDMLGIAGQEAGPTATLGAALIAADTSGGNWQYQLAGTKNWVDVGPVSATSALLLRPTDLLRYLPTVNANGPAPLTFKTWESVGPTGPGYGTATGTAVLDLTPILDLSVPATLNPIAAGQTTNEAAFNSLMSASRLVGGNLGVAITATKGTGTWEYRQAGGVWTPVGKVSTGKALFLNQTDEIRFTALATALPHTATLSFKAWDLTKVAPGTRGAATGSIVGKETETLTVAIGNTAPTLNTTPDVTLPNVLAASTKPSGGTLVKNLLGTAVTDTAKSLRGIAITAANNANGKWQYSLGGNVWLDVGVVSADAALLLTDVSKLRFVPNAGFTGSATIGYKAWDRTTGQAGDRIDTDSGLNSFSLDVETATVNVV